MRQEALDGSSLIKGDGPKYFGISHRGTKVQMLFPKNGIADLDSQFGMDVAIVAPSGTGTFNMLEPTYGAKLNMKDPKTIRAYLRKILESV